MFIFLMARLTAPTQKPGDKDADRKPCQYVGKAYAIAIIKSDQ